jgi:DNA-binding winged helix-turn-helix (wHTH) protein
MSITATPPTTQPLPTIGRSVTVAVQLSLTADTDVEPKTLQLLHELAQHAHQVTIQELPDTGPPQRQRDQVTTEEAAHDRVLIHPDSRDAYRGTTSLALTRVEFDLLLFLAENPRRAFTRLQLLTAVWGHTHAGERTVDVHIRRLRKKIGDELPLITTVYGIGYRLHDNALIVIHRQ